MISECALIASKALKLIVVWLCLSCAAKDVYAAAGSTVTLTVDAKTVGPQINRNIFGHFAEHLGRGIYGGIWVGEDSIIPNTRGIRNDVVAALQALKVPNVRWPGGCFADEYHWRDGVGGERRGRLNASWAGRIEPNTFGTHEYFDFISQIGADAFISANVGSGTVQEAADWLEYLTAENSFLANERARNGHKAPYKVALWGIGNEAWGCGGPFTAEEYLTKLKPFSNFSSNFNKAQPTQHVAVGPDGDGFAEYTNVIMKAWSTKDWAWDIQGLSLHRYTRNGWPPNILSEGFGEAQYAAVLHEALGMEQFIFKHSKIMDKYDPHKKVGIMVDEWGTWYAPTVGTDPGYLEQQNSQRDAIVAALNFNIFIRHAERVRGANIAQMVNVLQAVILTDQEKMLLTPTYHAFHLYAPFQNAKRLALTYKAGRYKFNGIKLPAWDAVAARGQDGRIWVAITHLNPNTSVTAEIVIKGVGKMRVEGQTLTAPAVNAVNNFGSPVNVAPKHLSVAQFNQAYQVTLAPHSVTVLSFEELP